MNPDIAHSYMEAIANFLADQSDPDNDITDAAKADDLLKKAEEILAWLEKL